MYDAKQLLKALSVVAHNSAMSGMPITKTLIDATVGWHVSYIRQVNGLLMQATEDDPGAGFTPVRGEGLLLNLLAAAVVTHYPQDRAVLVPHTSLQATARQVLLFGESGNPPQMLTRLLPHGFVIL